MPISSIFFDPCGLKTNSPYQRNANRARETLNPFTVTNTYVSHNRRAHFFLPAFACLHPSQFPSSLSSTLRNPSSHPVILERCSPPRFRSARSVVVESIPRTEISRRGALSALSFADSNAIKCVINHCFIIQGFNEAAVPR